LRGRPGRARLQARPADGRRGERKARTGKSRGSAARAPPAPRRGTPPAPAPAAARPARSQSVRGAGSGQESPARAGRPLRRARRWARPRLRPAPPAAPASAPGPPGACCSAAQRRLPALAPAWARSSSPWRAQLCGRPGRRALERRGHSRALCARRLVPARLKTAPAQHHRAAGSHEQAKALRPA